MDSERKNKDYRFAPLSEEQMKALKQTEAQLNMETGQEIIVLAYEKDKS